MNMLTPAFLLEVEDADIEADDLPGHDVDFSEYVWMGEEMEDFDRQVEEELKEQEFIDACFEELLAEEEADCWMLNQIGHNHCNTLQLPLAFGADKYSSSLCIQSAEYRKENVVNSSKLNPEAPEFFPNGSVNKLC